MNKSADGAINVLILSAGRRVELVKLFKETRDALKISGDVVAVDISKLAPALYFADKYEIVPRITSPDYVDSVISVCKKHGIKLVIPTIDTELPVLAAERQRIEKETGAIVNISSPECVDICNDKTKSACFFKENGFGVPYTYNDEELDEKKYSLPLFVKPRDGSSSIDAFKAETVSQLEFFRSYVKNPIVQECVEGTEYTVDAFIDFDGDIVSIVPRIRLAVRGGEILKGQIDMNKEIISDVEKLIKALKPVGHITIQGFLGKDGKMRYIEVNPRFGGGAPMSIRAGANSCEWLYRIAMQEKINPEQVKVDDKAVFVRFDDSLRIE